MSEYPLLEHVVNEFHAPLRRELTVDTIRAWARRREEKLTQGSYVEFLLFVNALGRELSVGTSRNWEKRLALVEAALQGLAKEVSDEI